MSSPFFSINIPAYNCEKWIIDAIESVKRQSFTDWEIVVLDDGSSDQTASLCRSQTIVPPEQFVFYSQTNKGPWEARRLMCEMSRGEYIVSLDGDDMLIDSDVLERIHDELIRTNCDVLLFNATKNLEKRDKFIDYSQLAVTADGWVEPTDALALMCVSYDLNNIWSKAYRRSCMHFDGVREGLVSTEDRLQCFQLLENVVSCRLLDQVFYYYRTTSGSTSQSSYRPILMDNAFQVESYIDSHAQALEYDRAERDRLLAKRIITFCGRVPELGFSRRQRIDYYRLTAERVRENGFLASGCPDGIILRWRLACSLLLSGHFALLDIIIVCIYLLKSLFR